MQSTQRLQNCTVSSATRNLQLHQDFGLFLVPNAPISAPATTTFMPGILLSKMALDIEELGTKTVSVSEEERQRTFEDLWREGNSSCFISSGFGDLTQSAEVNEEACKFLRAKN
jgi:hypothetical protein